MAKPQKCISIQRAETLYNNWHSVRAATLATLNSNDPSDFTFSLSELQEFLDYVKAESDSQGIKDPGIRVYFAAYSGENSNTATVFLAPTKGSDSDSSNNYDIESFNTVVGGWPPNVYNE